MLCEQKVIYFQSCKIKFCVQFRFTTWCAGFESGKRDKDFQWKNWLNVDLFLTQIYRVTSEHFENSAVVRFAFLKKKIMVFWLFLYGVFKNPFIFSWDNNSIWGSERYEVEKIMIWIFF